LETLTAGPVNTRGAIDWVKFNGQHPAVFFDNLSGSYVTWLGTALNQGPVANAGPDLAVGPATPVSINATAVDSTSKATRRLRSPGRSQPGTPAPLSR